VPQVYRYLSSVFGLQAVENGRLKVSNLSRLNDPFEFLPATDIPPDTPEYIVDAVTNRYVQEVADHFGLLSFSAQLSDPVLWGHYADSHKGLALAFEFPDSMIFPVTYNHCRPLVEFRDLMNTNIQLSSEPDFLREVYGQKAPSWSYECEHRTIVMLRDCTAKEGLYFWPFLPQYLKSVILGVRCTVSERYLKHLLSQHPEYAHVTICRGRISTTTYTISLN
jgi:hypothetical protein